MISFIFLVSGYIIGALGLGFIIYYLDKSYNENRPYYDVKSQTALVISAVCTGIMWPISLPCLVLVGFMYTLGSFL